MKKSFWLFILHICLLIFATGSVLSKMASSEPFLSFNFIVLYSGMLFSMVVYAFCWQQIIKHITLTTAYLNKAVTIVWGIFFGFFKFQEQITLKQLIGAVLIIIGIILFVKGDKEERNE